MRFGFEDDEEEVSGAATDILGNAPPDNLGNDTDEDDDGALMDPLMRV